MSFLVAYNGQFAPLTTPRVAGDSIPPVSSISHSGEVHEFKEILENISHEEHHKKPNQKLEIYKIAEKKFEAEKKHLHARDIMSSPVRLILQGAPASEAKAMLEKYGFRHLPVANENNVIVGMITDREVYGGIENKTCAEIMIQKVIVCEEHATVNEIAINLLRERINALPIVNRKFELVGIITHSDILKFVIETTMFLNRA